MAKSRMMFVNLPVRDLKRSVGFFTKLGFTFDQRFTDDNATCMNVGEQTFVMLLVEPYFRTFTKNEVLSTGTHTEALLALGCDSREEVDELVDTALANGGRAAMEPKDHGFMYVRSFYDPDGHHWELAHMSEMPPQA